MEELTTTKYKGLGKKESYLLLSLARADKKIFSINHAKEIIPKPKKIIHSLVKKKWILPLKRGLYALVPMEIGPKGADAFIIHDFIIASYLEKHYYIGFWSALNYHGLTDEIPRTVFIATRKAKKPLNILTSEFYFVKLSKKKFFGYNEVEIEANKINISDINKTVTDCLDHPEHAGGIDEVARSIFFNHKELDFERIRKYALRMNNLTILKRLGLILERTGLLNKYKRIFANIDLPKSYSLLDTISPKKGDYNKKWFLIENVTIDKEAWMY